MPQYGPPEYRAAYPARLNLLHRTIVQHISNRNLMGFPFMLPSRRTSHAPEPPEAKIPGSIMLSRGFMLSMNLPSANRGLGRLLAHALGTVRQRQSVQHLVHITGQETVQLIERQADAMIRHPSLRVVIGADALAAIAATHL